MKTQGMKLFHQVVCFLTALAAIHVGLIAMNYNLLSMGFLAQFAKPIEYIFGLAGVAALVMFFMHIFCDCAGGSCSTRS